MKILVSTEDTSPSGIGYSSGNLTLSEMVATKNIAITIDVLRNHLNFVLPDISSSACGRMKLFYASRWG
jgi:hypothetical protein